jgi:4-hydroxysphinganine ceramide fatty acyl 2-hydroxylase
VVPLVWVPVALYLFCSEALANGHDVLLLGILTAAGIFTWWSIEYGLHRCVFHMDSNLPDHPVMLTVHFLLHGIHHKVPMDRMRLVMPPALLAVLASAMYPIIRSAFFFLPNDLANYVFGVALLGYVGYDVFHYSFHHIDLSKLPDPFAYNLTFLKKHHMKHHYADSYNLGYGITTVFFDRLFGTELPVVMPSNWRTAKVDLTKPEFLQKK